jgi:hypothetical protein
MQPRLAFVAAAAAVLLGAPAAPAQWTPAKGPLQTRWAKDVTPDRVHPEYPRPQLVRKDWLNLNGLWDYAVRPRGEGRPDRSDGRILVPFPIESALSGVMKRVGNDQRLWYSRRFELPPGWKGKRVLLHFGAVDWEAEVWVNGKSAGTHRGGYDPFRFDVTNLLAPEGPQEVVVAAWDPTDSGKQPLGKQHRNPHGIWYTPTTGIWQTVWLEPVPQAYISALKIVPDLDAKRARVTATAGGGSGGARVRATVLDSGREVARAEGPAGQPIDLEIQGAKPWSPSSPFLYDLRVELLDGGAAVDAVESYFGLRKVSLGKDADGITRILLNGEPLFQLGPLDQGFWPDGLYTAPNDEALRWDVELTRRLGFNMCRKHVKVEPARWYSWCDRLGLLVWQDMPSGDAHVRPGRGEIQREPEAAQQFEAELGRMIDALENHPSIVLWVVFNEGWGQYDTVRLTSWVKERDPTRLADCASGWNDFPAGDVIDMHSYPGPGSPRPDERRAAVLGEFGGLGLPLAGHTWQEQRNWGYRSFETPEALTSAYVRLIDNLRPLIRSPGLSAAVYTQTTDVEIEVNGLVTYDREVMKLDEKQVVEAHRKVHLPPPILRDILPTSEKEGAAWRYTTDRPADGWEAEGFDDAGWKEGPGGFGSRGTPGAVVRTEWTSPDIWLRRSFLLPKVAVKEPRLRIHHDEDAEVHLNGRRIASVRGYTTGYVTLSIDAEGRSALRPGKNVLAVHCHQTGGGQYIDLGLVDFIEVEQGPR